MGENFNKKEKLKDNDSREDDLFNFREAWQHELLNSQKSSNQVDPTIINNKAPQKNNNETSEDELNEKATALYQKGIEMENSNKLYEAIQYYRQAVQIVPDIEFRMNKKVKLKPTNTQEQDVNENIFDGTLSGSEDENSEDEDIFLKIQRKVSKNSLICTPKQPVNGLHIGQLPMEIILYILKWVVSDQLDLRSLEMFSEVCRRFYIYARDPKIWQLACLRIWGVNCGSSPGVYKTWRNMFIDRPRVNFNGCYISKTTYIRNGENSFQDQFYRPWYIVAYYRYLRFYPDGTVLMLTSADEPLQSVHLLKSRNARYPVLSGYYRLKDDKVIVVVQKLTKSSSQEIYKRSKKLDMSKKTEQIYNMEFQIRSKKKKHEQLHWCHYSIVTKSKRGDENTCNFDLFGNRYPPLYFSRVKSYTENSEGPLV